MATIASLLVNLQTNFGNTNAAFSGLIAQLTQLGQTTQQTGQHSQQTGQHIQGMGNAAHTAHTALESLKDLLSDLAGELLKFGAETLALTSIFEALKESVEVSAELESTRVALESLTGSAEKATEVLENMEKVASDEALSFGALVPASQHMIALGFSIEETTEIMKVAGNASWALGTSVESVSQRIAFMAESGRVNSRIIKTLGITMEDLGTIMGVSAGEVTKAFQVLDQSQRVEILTMALEKFGGVGAKQAETVKGKWNELKNSWHETFASMGDDIQDLTKGLETFVSFAGKAAGSIADAFGDIHAQRLKDLKKTAENLGGPKPPENPETKKEELKENTEKALEPLRAKEEATVRLEEIRGEEEANARSAQLNREKTEAIIKEEHDRRQAEIDGNQDATERARLTAAEEIRFAKEKQEKIGEIDAEEAKKKSELIRARIGPEVAKTYTPIPDEGRRATEIASINQKAKNDLEKVADDLILKQQKASDAVAAAISKQVIGESKIVLGQTRTQQDIEGGKLKSDAEIKSIGYQEQKIKLEGQYQAQLGHTYEQEIANLNAVAEAEKKSREETLSGLQAQLAFEKSKPTNDDAAQKKRAQLEEQIAKSKAEGAKADAESANALIKAGTDYQKLLLEIAKTKRSSDTEVQAEKINQQKIKSEADYAALSAHSNEEEIAHLKQIATLEEAERQAKIQGLQADKAALPQGKEFDSSRADLAKQIATLQEQAATATLQSAIKVTTQMEAQNGLLQAQKDLADSLTNWAKIDLGTVAQQFTQTFTALPGQVGESLANSIFTNARRGQSKGAEIGQGLVQTVKKSGEEVAGKLISDAIQKLIVQLIGQGALDALNNSVTTANTAAIIALTAALGANTGLTAANTGATVAHSGVMLAHLGVMISHLAVMIGNTIATVANTLATWAEAIAGFFGFASGGDPDPSKPFIAGEKGPELIHPKGTALTVIPNKQTQSILDGYDPGSFDHMKDITAYGKTTNMIDTTHMPSSGDLHTTSFSGDMHIHLTQNANPRQHAEQIFRELPNVAKARGSRWSPYSK